MVYGPFIDDRNYDLPIKDAYLPYGYYDNNYNNHDSSDPMNPMDAPVGRLRKRRRPQLRCWHLKVFTIRMIIIN